MNRILFAAAATLTLAASGLAQYQPVGNDGIAASPKLRQTINESALVAPAAVAPKAAMACCEDTIVASPKVLQTLPPQPKCCAVSVKESLASTTAKTDDGVFASPKVREQLN